MAEEVNIVVNVEGGKGGKTVKEVRKELDAAAKSGNKVSESVKEIGVQGQSVKARLKALKDEMANIGNIGSPRFQELAAEAGKLKDQMNNANAAINTMSSDFGKLQVGIEAFTAIGSAAQFAAGAQLLLGEENKEVAKALQRVVALTTMMSAVQQVANSLSDESALGIALRTARMKLLNKAMLEQAVSTGTATTAQKVFNFILKQNPIALIITAVASLTAGLIWLGKNVKAVGDFFTWMGDMAQDALNATLAFFGFTGEAIETQGRKERRLQEQRREADGELKRAHADRMNQITSERDAVIDAKNDEIKALKKEIEINDNVGKSSDELTVKVLEAQLAKIEAVRDATKSMIESWTEYYKQQAILAGQSEDEFIESLKQRGIDLEALNDQAQKLLADQEQDVQVAESRITKFKREQHEKRSAEAQKQRDKELAEEQKRLDELEKLAQKEFEANQKAADELFNRRVKAKELLLDLEAKASNNELAVLEREHQKKIEKLDENIPEEHELILFYEQELRDKKQELQAQWDAEDEAAEQQRKETRDQERIETIDDAEKTATELISIAESANQLLHGKELKRIKAKQQAGEQLTRNEIKRLKQEERIRKIQAIAQITADTARGISGAIAAGAGIPFPLNLGAIITGISAVLAGAAQAAAVLGESQDFGGVGGASSATDTAQQLGEQTPNVNAIQSGSTLIDQEPTQVYVVESDITGMQNKVDVIESQASFGMITLLIGICSCMF